MSSNINYISQTIGRLLTQANDLERYLSRDSQPELNEINAALATMTLLIEDVDKTSQPAIRRSIETVQNKVRDLQGRIETLKTNPVHPRIVPTNNSNNNANNNNLFYADHHQMSDVYIPLYTGKQADPANRRSACTMIAGEFVGQMLLGARFDQLDQIMRSGQQKMVDSRANAGTIFDEVIGHFPTLELLPLTERMLNINPVGEIAFDRQLGKNGFKAAIELLQELKRDKKLESLGAVLTNPPETYAIVLLGEQIVFFDSHGDMPHNGGLVKGPAYATAFPNSDQAADFLAKRLPVMEFMPDRSREHVNVDKILQDERIDLNQPLGLIRLFPLTSKQQAKKPIPAPSLPAPQQPAPVPVEQPVVSLVETTQLLNTIAKGFANEEIDVSAYEALTNLDQKSKNLIFKNLYQILVKESKAGKINEENLQREYGARAFETQANPAERLRAIQQAIVEVSMLGLEEAIQNNNLPLLKQYLDILESVKLEKEDAPKDKTNNVAHLLYGSLYHIYLRAWEADKKMLHPHDGAFRNDFGRFAMRGETSHTINNQFKLEAIRLLRQELNQIWKK